METSNEKIQEVGRNIQEKAALVWSVADDLVGAFKPHEYGLVVLPMAVIKRFHDCLLSTHDKVRETYAKVEKLAVKDGFLKKASGYQFYNTSKFTFDILLADADNIKDNFENYLNHFSENVIDIINRMDFYNEIKKMDVNNRLCLVIKVFSYAKAYLGSDVVPVVDMG